MPSAPTTMDVFTGYLWCSTDVASLAAQLLEELIADASKDKDYGTASKNDMFMHIDAMNALALLGNWTSIRARRRIIKQLKHSNTPVKSFTVKVFAYRLVEGLSWETSVNWRRVHRKMSNHDVADLGLTHYALQVKVRT